MNQIKEIILKNLKQKFQEFLYFSAFLKTTIVELFLIGKRKQVVFLVLLRQILFTGFEALKLVTFVGLGIGAVIIIQGMALLDTFGQSGLVYSILIMVITKELGPI